MTARKLNKFLGMEILRRGYKGIRWREFNPNTFHEVNPELLWTIRISLYDSGKRKGGDKFLKRSVYTPAERVKEVAYEFYKSVDQGRKGMVYYYPSFYGLISGVVEVNLNYFLVEALKGEPWEFDRGNVETSYLFKLKDCRQEEIIHQGKEILENWMLQEIMGVAYKARWDFRDLLAEGKSIFLEWSIAKNCSRNKEQFGEPYFVVYEIHEV